MPDGYPVGGGRDDLARQKSYSAPRTRPLRVARNTRYVPSSSTQQVLEENVSILENCYGRSILQQCRNEIYTVLEPNEIKGTPGKTGKQEQTPMWIKINLTTTPSIGRYEKKKKRLPVVHRQP
ncbi:hypothetical protein FJTKL_14323 [Diaporthe vaccinii]|uniref:Uncharacterized protein n=1 Tax=Diaporthe vaccinii TaxID=105482 RepID=A0ABR4E854_9PEZI